MTYEETIELEKNIKLKNEANEIYDTYIKKVKLSVCDYEGNGSFRVWSDSHNAEYIVLSNDKFFFVCDFLHERYSFEISLESIFQSLKNNYRGLDHFKSYINK